MFKNIIKRVILGALVLGLWIRLFTMLTSVLSLKVVLEFIVGFEMIVLAFFIGELAIMVSKEVIWMWKGIFKLVIKLFSSNVGKVLIDSAIDEYVKSNDNDMTHDIANEVKKMITTK